MPGNLLNEYIDRADSLLQVLSPHELKEPEGPEDEDPEIDWDDL